MKMLSSKQKQILFYLLLVSLPLLTILSQVLSYDAFVGGPEAMLLEDNIDFFGDFKRHPHYSFFLIGAYYFFDFIFLFSIGLLMMNHFKEHISESKHPGLQKISNIGIAIAGMYMITDIMGNGIGLYFYMTEPEPPYSSAYNVDVYTWLHWIKVICFSLMFVTLFLIFAWKRLDKENKPEVATKELNNKDDENTDQSQSKKNNVENEILVGLKRISFGLVLSLLIFFLLYKIDQGQVIVMDLVSRSYNLFFMVVMLIIIFQMTLVNPYYTDKSILCNHYYYYRKYGKSWFMRFFIPACFQWSRLQDKDGSSELLKSTVTLGALTHRIFALSHIWIALFVCLHVRNSVIDSNFFFGFFPPWILYVVFTLVLISTIAVLYDHPVKVVDGDGNLKKSYVRNFLILSVASLLLLITILILPAEENRAILARIDLLILFFILLNYALALLLLFRRRIGFLENKRLTKFMWIFCDDVVSKTIQGASSLVLLGGAIYLHFTANDFIYRISSINVLLSVIIIWFFIGQMISSYRTKYKFFSENPDKLENSNLPSKYNLLGHYLIPVTALFIVGLLLIKNFFIQDPEYHTIPFVPKEEERVSLLTYLEKLKPSDQYFMIANEGGGLRANYWSMKVLSELEDKSQGSFYQKTIATCGASGGAIGQGLFSLLKSDTTISKEKMSNIIREMGETDFLTRDVFSFLYPRALSQLALTKFDHCKHLDLCRRRGDIVQARKYGSMMLGSNDLIKQDTFFDSSIEAFWHEAYKRNKESFPLTIINAAHVSSGLEGVVSPIKDQHEIFNGIKTINDLTLHGKPHTLSYINSLFLTNRFPLVSPVAIVPSKGKFIDSGTFDNNGLTSLLDLLIYIESQTFVSGPKQNRWQEVWDKICNKITIIIIQNGEYSYMTNAIETNSEDVNNVYSNSNLGSSFKSATSTSAVKEYLKKYIEKKRGSFLCDVKHINLPYLIESKDVLDNVYGGQLPHQERIWQKIRAHDSILIRDLELEGKIYLKPPLGRVLSRPVQAYMDSAIESKRVQKEIDAVFICE